MVKTFNSDNDQGTFEGAQFHFHSPSEHTIDGELMDLEVHVVNFFKSGEESVASVFGVFFDHRFGGDKENLFLSQFDLDAITSEAKNDKESVMTVDMMAIGSFMQSTDYSEFWSYDGSLTTPPCTEGIRWNVMRQVMPISSEQAAAWAKALSANEDGTSKVVGNNRVTMPYNDREVVIAGKPEERWANTRRNATIALGVLMGLFAVGFIILFTVACACPSVCKLQKKEKAQSHSRN